MITFDNYLKPETLEEAWELNQKPANRIIGGMLWLRLSNTHYDSVIDISGLGLDFIEETDEQLRFGAMTPLRKIETCASFADLTCGASCEALRHIVGVQFRNLATIGGSIYSKFGFSDVVTLFLPLDSYVELYKAGTMPLAEFLERKPDRDILVSVIVKKHPQKAVYRSVRNTYTDFPVINMCACLGEDGKLNFTVGCRPARAVNTVFEISEAASIPSNLAEGIKTGSNSRGSAEYRTHLIKVLSGRMINELLEEN